MSAHHIDITSGGRCYRLDLRGRELYQERDKRVRVTRQQWDLLRYFVENPGALLSKEQLHDNVWKGAAVTDEAISLAVRALRKALQDNKDSPDFIETVHGQGYRFIAGVESFIDTNDDLRHSDTPQSKSLPTQKTEYSDGDWITAAIVGPDRAQNWLRGAAARLNRLLPEDRTVDTVEKYLEDRIADLNVQHEKGGTTDNTRLEACIAKVVSDILTRELATFLWNVVERPGDEDAISLFRDTVRDFVEKQGTGRGQTRPGFASSQKPEVERPSANHPSQSSEDRSKERDSIRRERNEKLVASLKTHEGIEDCWVMQLEDHSDNGYLIDVKFDSAQCSAAGATSLIRNILDEMLPPVPFWGELKFESENSVGFAYTYIDEFNRALKRA